MTAQRLSIIYRHYELHKFTAVGIFINYNALALIPVLISNHMYSKV